MLHLVEKFYNNILAVTFFSPGRGPPSPSFLPTFIQMIMTAPSAAFADSNHLLTKH